MSNFLTAQQALDLYNSHAATSAEVREALVHVDNCIRESIGKGNRTTFIPLNFAARRLNAEFAELLYLTVYESLKSRDYTVFRHSDDPNGNATHLKVTF